MTVRDVETWAEALTTGFIGSAEAPTDADTVAGVTGHPSGATAVADHSAGTTGVHGITDTSLLSLTSHGHSDAYEPLGAVADEAAARDGAIAAHADVVPSPFVFGVPATAPADGDLTANQISFWSNDGLNLLGFKMKNSAGVVKIGTVALT